MALKKYDVIKTIIPFSTEEDKKNGHKTLNSQRLMEAQLSNEFKNRPCVVIGQNKKTGNVIIAEIRSNRNKSFRSMLNDPAEAGIEATPKLETSDKELLSKLEKAEAGLSGSATYDNDYEI